MIYLLNAPRKKKKHCKAHFVDLGFCPLLYHPNGNAPIANLPTRYRAKQGRIPPLARIKPTAPFAGVGHALVIMSL